MQCSASTAVNSGEQNIRLKNLFKNSCTRSKQPNAENCLIAESQLSPATGTKHY